MGCICQDFAGLSIILLTAAPVIVFLVCVYKDMRRMGIIKVNR